ncbi:hypothetical protein MPH_05451 [Macrophomina phaseolina MS6]|uniref:Uncharacterized protein n=1 Tax=Macrophomina phaseolina (strain MS6) TaxID=1126212 RepID=K2RRP3_MACPH|nr:hypothetical protein MPH_05451 [Macrophomina phaseolina MS6]
MAEMNFCAKVLPGSADRWAAYRLRGGVADADTQPSWTPLYADSGRFGNFFEAPRSALRCLMLLTGTRPVQSPSRQPPPSVVKAMSAFHQPNRVVENAPCGPGRSRAQHARGMIGYVPLVPILLQRVSTQLHSIQNTSTSSWKGPAGVRGDRTEEASHEQFVLLN